MRCSTSATRRGRNCLLLVDPLLTLCCSALDSCCGVFLFVILSPDSQRHSDRGSDPGRPTRADVSFVGSCSGRADAARAGHSARCLRGGEAQAACACWLLPYRCRSRHCRRPDESAASASQRLVGFVQYRRSLRTLRSSRVCSSIRIRLQMWSWHLQGFDSTGCCCQIQRCQGCAPPLPPEAHGGRTRRLLLPSRVVVGSAIKDAVTVATVRSWARSSPNDRPDGLIMQMAPSLSLQHDDVADWFPSLPFALSQADLFSPHLPPADGRAGRSRPWSLSWL